MKIGELFVALGFQVDQKKIDNYNVGLSTTRLKALSVAAAISAATLAVVKFSDASVRYAVTLKNFAIQTGLSIDALERWRFVAEQNDVSGEELINTIKGIQRAQAEIKLGAGNIRPWQLLGINPNDNPFTILEKIRGSIKNLDPALAASVLGQLGIGQNFLNILKASNLEFDKLNEKFLLTKQERQDLIALNRVFKDVIFSLRGLRNRLFSINAGPLTKVAKAVKNVASFIIDATIKIRELAERFSFLGKVLSVGAAAIAAYFFPITAGVIAVIAIIDDLYIFLQDGESIIGDFVSLFNFGPFLAELEKIKPKLKSLVDFIVSDVGPVLKEVFLVVFDLITVSIQGFVTALTGALSLLNKVVDIGKNIGEFFSSDETFKKKSSNILDIIKSGPSGIDTTSSIINNKNAQSSNKVTNNINVNVNGATSPTQTANAVIDSLQSQLNNAYFQTPNLGAA
ncbi:hypothetical protein KAR91_59430 [Candidatus Pacearchaeota archaeon]|nr:hypothetical protein [Candidatus Pacearchaeota archaeon]